MDFNDRKISGSTQLKDFPERYNDLIKDLNFELTKLEGLLNKQNAEILNLKNTIATLETNLKSSLGAWFDQKMDEFENTFEKKTN